jgi:hypothetical protein
MAGDLILRVRRRACGARKGVPTTNGATMSEPSSGVPRDTAEEVEAPLDDAPKSVELALDEEKLEAWDEVKSDYQVDPDSGAVPNSMDTDHSASAAEGEADAADS